VSAGATIHDEITVQSFESVPVRITLHIQPVVFEDWTYAPVFGGRHAHDASGWYLRPQIIVDLPPYQKAIIPIDATTPRTFHSRLGVYWAMATLDEIVPSEPTRILPEFQIPLIFLTPSQTRPNVVMGTPELNCTSRVTTVQVPFLNPSEGYASVGCVATLRSGVTGRVLATYQQMSRNLYPGTRRKLNFSLGELPPGNYRISAQAEIGFRRLPAISTDFVATSSGVTQLSANETFVLTPVEVTPSFLQQSIAPGGRRSAAIQVTNTTLTPLRVSVVPRMLSQAPTGALELSETAMPTGVSLIAMPAALYVGAKQTANVRLVLQADKGVDGDNWFGVAVKDIASTTSFSEMAVAVLSVQGPQRPKLSLEPGQVLTSNGYPYAYQYVIANQGNLALKPICSATLLSGNGSKPIARLDVPVLGEGGIIPGARLTNRISIPATLQPNSYILEINYQYGTNLASNLRAPFRIAKALLGKSSR
jgi:hypothetical protein